MFEANFYFGCLDDGIDTRIHGLKIASTREAEMGLSVDIFTQKDKIFRYPALELYNKRALYRRAQVLQRYGFCQKCSQSMDHKYMFYMIAKLSHNSRE